MHEKILGILGSGYPDVKTIMKHYRMKLNIYILQVEQYNMFT